MIFQSLHFLGISFIFFLVSRSRCQVFPRPYARIARQSCSTEQPDSTDAFVTSLMHTTNTDLGLWVRGNRYISRRERSSRKKRDAACHPVVGISRHSIFNVLRRWTGTKTGCPFFFFFLRPSPRNACDLNGKRVNDFVHDSLSSYLAADTVYTWWRGKLSVERESTGNANLTFLLLVFVTV